MQATSKRRAQLEGRTGMAEVPPNALRYGDKVDTLLCYIKDELVNLVDLDLPRDSVKDSVILYHTWGSPLGR
jgi:hypothetical protein